MSMLNQNPEDENAPKWLQWLKRIGWLGFAFFLIKGLLWVAFWIAIYMGFKK